MILLELTNLQTNLTKTLQMDLFQKFATSKLEEMEEPEQGKSAESFRPKRPSK